jgi:hypothetical protein
VKSIDPYDSPFQIAKCKTPYHPIARDQVVEVPASQIGVSVLENRVCQCLRLSLADIGRLISLQGDRLRSPHGSRRGRDSNAVPSSDSIPALPCPPTFPLVGTRVPAMRTRLWVAAWRDFGLGRGALVLSIYCRLRHDRLRARTTSGAAADNAQRKLNSLLPGSAVQPSAGRPSSHSFHSEVFSSARLLLSIPLVQLCAAHKPKTTPCSLPRPPAPLRSGD